MLEAKTNVSSSVMALWERKRPLMLERLMVLDLAAEAAGDGGLERTLCARAAGEAHKLAGSLGTFGFPKGTEIARALEQGLACGSLQPGEIKELTARLRETLFPSDSSR